MKGIACLEALASPEPERVGLAVQANLHKSPPSSFLEEGGKRGRTVWNPCSFSSREPSELSVPTAAIDQSVATTRLILVLGILAALAIAAALTLPLINVALRPLVEMERVSSRIAAGALSLRLAEPPAQDEIGRMARAFNSMVARLEASFARQRRFVADVSHELRTPLTGLGGSLEMLLLRADNGDEETVRRLMSGMHAEVERMQLLVEDLLALTRLDEGRIKLRVEAVDVSQLVNEVREQIQGLLHGQEVCYQVPSDLPALRGDIDQLRRVLLNVVENAVKF